MKIGTLTTGDAVATTINLTYLPQKIWFAVATQLTSIKIEVLGLGVIVDLNTAGINTLCKAGKVGGVTNGFELQLADGLVVNKNVVMTFVNSAAQTPDINAYSDGVGNVILKSTQQKVFASSGTDIDGSDFAFLSLVNGTLATDELNLTLGGITQKFKLSDLQNANSENSAIQNTASDYYILQGETFGSRVDNVNYIPSSDTILYFVSIAEIV